MDTLNTEVIENSVEVLRKGDNQEIASTLEKGEKPENAGTLEKGDKHENAGTLEKGDKHENAVALKEYQELSSEADDLESESSGRCSSSSESSDESDTVIDELKEDNLEQNVGGNAAGDKLKVNHDRPMEDSGLESDPVPKRIKQDDKEGGEEPEPKRGSTY